MASVCPTITAYDSQSYREQMARIAAFADRVHIDLADGVFAPTLTINPVHVYWPDKLTADLHLMLKNPAEHLETVLSLGPNLAIIHAEADGDLLGIVRQLQAVNIKAGVALLQPTKPADYAELIAEADHVLIFSGNLGHQGGAVLDMNLLNKVGQIRSINPMVEIGWDGGISSDNIANLALGGIEVFDVGSSIHNAVDPKDAYATLKKNLPKQMAGL